MGVTTEEMRLILSAKDEASKHVKTVTGALQVLQGLAIVQAAARLFRPLLRVVKELGTDAIRAAGAYEAMGISAQNLLAAQKRLTDSALTHEEALKAVSKETQELLDWIVRTGIQTPLMAENIRTMWRKLVIAELPSEFAKQVTTSAADIVAAFGLTSREQTSLIRAFGDMAAKGYLAGEEMRQLSNAGFGYAQVARIMGITTEEVTQALKDKTIVAEQFFTKLLVWAEQYEGMGKTMVTSWAYVGQTMQEVKDLALVKFFGEWNAELGEMTGILGELQPAMGHMVDSLTDPAFIASLSEMGTQLGDKLAPMVPQLVEGFDDLLVITRALTPVLADLGVRGFGTILKEAGLVLGLSADLVRIWNALKSMSESMTPPLQLLGLELDDLGKALQFIKDASNPALFAFRLLSDAVGNLADAMETLKDIKPPSWLKTAGLVMGIGVPTFQAGGTMLHSGLALVGERGPELLQLPAGTGVYNAAQTQGMMQGGPAYTQTFHVTINAPGGDPRAVRGATETGMLAALRAAGMPI